MIEQMMHYWLVGDRQIIKVVLLYIPGYQASSPQPYLYDGHLMTDQLDYFHKRTIYFTITLLDRTKSIRYAKFCVSWPTTRENEEIR
jgi:hypothetical protein